MGILTSVTSKHISICLLAVGALVATTFAGNCAAQEPTSPIVAFEVASIKPAESAERRGFQLNFKFRPSPTGLSGNAVTVKDCILWAYELEEYQLSGPSSIDAVKFDIIAKAPERVDTAKLRRMLQALLVERFRLAVHSTRKEETVFVLTVDGKAPTVGPATGDANYSLSSALGARTLTGKLSMATLAQVLRRELKRPVIDKTECAGLFDIRLQWRLDGVAEPPGGALQTPQLFAAVREQLGLTLQAVKGFVDLLVVDRVERMPTQN